MPTASATSLTPKRPRLKRPIRRTPGNLVLFLALGALSTMLAIGAAAAIYISGVAYQAGHQPTPTSAVYGFLDAALRHRQMSDVDKYLCADTARRQARTLLNQIAEVESSGASVDFFWADPHVVSHTGGDRAVVTDTVRATVTSNGTRQPQSANTWRFNLRNQGGWKICSFTTGQR